MVLAILEPRGRVGPFVQSSGLFAEQVVFKELVFQRGASRPFLASHCIIAITDLLFALSSLQGLTWWLNTLISQVGIIISGNYEVGQASLQSPLITHSMWLVNSFLLPFASTSAVCLLLWDGRTTLRSGIHWASLNPHSWLLVLQSWSLPFPDQHLPFTV